MSNDEVVLANVVGSSDVVVSKETGLDRTMLDRDTVVTREFAVVEFVLGEGSDLSEKLLDSGDIAVTERML